MYKILVATDGSVQSRTTIDETARIAAPLGAEVTVLSVAEGAESLAYAASIPEEILSRVKQDQEKYYSKAVQEAKTKLAGQGIQVKTLVVKGDPVDVICSTAEKEGSDLIIVGRRRLGKFEGMLMGSVSNKVMLNAKTNVMVVKE